ncbi:MAG: four helix bundle protein [Deltaproteobacteria bacterium]|nr:four helix bundle protein [Deltaproteobacteria bacterium]
MIQSYKDLEVYQRSYRLAVEIDRMTKQLPKHEFWEEGQQIRKSSKAIPAHIAEGYGRKRYIAEYRRFAIYALSSCDETQVHLGLLHDCDSIDDQTYNYFHAEYNTLGKKLNNWLMRIETF